MWGSRGLGWRSDAYVSWALLESWGLWIRVPDTAVHGIWGRLHCFHVAVRWLPPRRCVPQGHNIVFEFHLRCPRWVWRSDADMVIPAQIHTGRLGNPLHVPLEMIHRVSVPKKVLFRLAPERNADYRDVPWEGRAVRHDLWLA